VRRLARLLILLVRVLSTGRRRVVSKHSVGEFSQSGRRRRIGMERGRLRVDRIGKRELLSSSTGESIGEGDL
jgi:hypothetical protein